MKSWIVASLGALALGACAAPENTTAPLVFGQAQTVGLSVGPSSTGATGEFVFGYRDVNIAIIPTLVPNGAPGEDGFAHKLVSSGVTKEGAVDAYSTFGQFQFSGEGAKVGLGKFFATGLAAQYLAKGFGCGAAGDKVTKCEIE